MLLFLLKMHDWVNEQCDIMIKDFDTESPLIGYLSFSREQAKDLRCYLCDDKDKVCYIHEDKKISQLNYIMLARQRKEQTDFEIRCYSTINEDSVPEDPKFINADKKLQFDFEPKQSAPKEVARNSISKKTRKKPIPKVDRPDKKVHLNNFPNSIMRQFLLDVLSDKTFERTVIFCSTSFLRELYPFHQKIVNQKSLQDMNKISVLRFEKITFMSIDQYFGVRLPHCESFFPLINYRSGNSEF